MPTMKAPPQENADPPEELRLTYTPGAEDSPGLQSTTSAQVLFAEGAEAVVIAPNPTMSMKSSASIRKSALPPKAQAAFERCMRDRDIDASEIAMEDVLEGFEMKERAVRQNRQLKYLVVSLVVAVILLCAGAFASSFAAVQLSKEARISQTGAMVDINSVNGDQTIVQVAPSTDSKLSLIHALVLDEAHLRTMDEIVYTYWPLEHPGTERTRTTKVMEVERDVGENPWDINVTIKLEANSSVLIRPQEENALVLLTGGEAYPLCGRIRCSNFKVDDPDLDVPTLDKKVTALFQTHPDPNERRLKERKMFLLLACYIAFTNYGCCSSKAQFAVFKSVDWLKMWAQPDDAKCQDNPSLHNFKGPSEACFGHDICLSECAANKCGSRTFMKGETKCATSSLEKTTSRRRGKSWERTNGGDYTVYNGDQFASRRRWSGRRREFKYTSNPSGRNQNCFADDARYQGGIEDCNCKKKCDDKLVEGLRASSCGWDPICHTRKAIILKAMGGLPNKCCDLNDQDSDKRLTCEAKSEAWAIWKPKNDKDRKTNCR